MLCFCSCRGVVEEALKLLPRNVVGAMAKLDDGIGKGSGSVPIAAGEKVSVSEPVIDLVKPVGRGRSGGGVTSL